MFLEFIRFPLHRSRRRPRRWSGRKKFTFHVRYRGAMFGLTYVPWRGIYVSAIWRAWKRGGTLNPPDVRREIPGMKKRTVKADAGDNRHLAALESNLFRDLLPLVEHCAIRRYEDDEPRHPGWITIQTNGAAWEVVVKEPDGACKFKAIAETLDKALETAALLLACDEAPWEPDPYLVSQKARKKK